MHDRSSGEHREQDYYEVLGVPSGASKADLTRAFRRQAQIWHPDHRPTDPEAEQRFRELHDAYRMLADEERRRSYDDTRQPGTRRGRPIPVRYVKRPPSSSATPPTPWIRDLDSSTRPVELWEVISRLGRLFGGR